jgi:hypothetical protein
MEFHRQLITNHNPDDGIFGDCQRTAIACLLNKFPSEVPNFATPETWNNGETFDLKIREYLKERGLSWFCLAYDGNPDVDTLLHAIGHLNPDNYYMLCGQSTRGINHVVVCKGTKIIHDPHPSDSKLSSPCDDGYWWVYILTVHMS